MLVELKQLLKRYFWFFILFFIVLLILFFSFFLKKEISFMNQKGGIKTEAKILADRVGEHMFLPIDEVPTIATVSDPHALLDQEFFKDAKKGDKVLIYSNAKKAILYDPSADKIITIAPLSLDEKDKKTNNKNFLNNNF